VTVIYCKTEDIKNPAFYREGISERELIEAVPLNEWITEHYTEFGANLEYITDKSPEGFQFCKGFMGFGGFLRYKMDLDNF